MRSIRAALKLAPTQVSKGFWSKGGCLKPKALEAAGFFDSSAWMLGARNLKFKSLGGAAH